MSGVLRRLAPIALLVLLAATAVAFDLTYRGRQESQNDGRRGVAGVEFIAENGSGPGVRLRKGS